MTAACTTCRVKWRQTVTTQIEILTTPMYPFPAQCLMWQSFHGQLHCIGLRALCNARWHFNCCLVPGSKPLQWWYPPDWVSVTCPSQSRRWRSQSEKFHDRWDVSVWSSIPCHKIAYYSCRHAMHALCTTGLHISNRGAGPARAPLR